jgi:hypothetical protein
MRWFVLLVVTVGGLTFWAWVIHLRWDTCNRLFDNHAAQWICRLS